MKSAEKHLCLTFSSFWTKLSFKNVSSNVLVKMFFADDKYSRLNKENLPLQIQIQLRAVIA